VKLGGATIAQHARDAGFYGEAVPIATAIALGSSGGLTHYQHRAGMPGAGDWRGLWAINVDEHPHLAELELFDPIVNAWAAHELSMAGDGFGWHAAYRTGWYTGFVDHAGVEATRLPHQDQAVQPYTVHTATHRIRHALESVHGRLVGKVTYG
jgi:hypothetical protein